jgi:TolB protein
VNADGSGTPARLTDTAGADANPAWSPTGDRIAFESNRAEGGKPDIYVMNADGSGIPTRLTNFDLEDAPTTFAVTKPTWSPTGDRIAFHRRVKDADPLGDHLQIYTMNADGTNVTQITFTPTPPTTEFSGFPSWGNWTDRR